MKRNFTNDNPSSCALCNTIISSHPIMEGLHTFCCMGCHAVFNILSSQGKTGEFQDHPVFLEALRSGLISNPALLESIKAQRAGLEGLEKEKLHLEIGNMWCPSCAEIIRLILLKEKGVINCVVDYATDLAAIEFCPRYLSAERLMAIINSLGYKSFSLDQAQRKAVSADLYIRFGVAAFCALNLMMFAYPLYATYFNYDGEGYGHLFAWLSLFISLPTIFYSGWPIWRRFWTSLQVGFYGMETLVFIGVGAAFGLSLYELAQGGTRVYFDSMSVIIAFVLLGKIIEAKAKFSAKAALLRLSYSIPKRARKCLPDGTASFVPAKEIVTGNHLIVKAGEKITFDGVVVKGEGTCDESLMTGESVPLLKKCGSGVLGGTILVQGHLEFRVTACMQESALHKIIEMVERDIGHKNTYVRAADKIVQLFVPTVLALAAVAGMIYWLMPANGDLYPTETAWMRFLAVLLISCPCAIGIAAPTAESQLLNSLAALGAIVRNRGCLAFLGKETVYIFDKTGTVTEGQFAVLSGWQDVNAQDRVALKALTSLSAHPISHAIARSLDGVEPAVVTQFEEVIGYGLRGVVDGKLYLLGSARFLQNHAIAIEASSTLNNAVLTTVYFAVQQKCLATMQLGDSLRPGMLSLVNLLKPARTILLSGDALAAVETVAKKCQFDEWHALKTPLEKRAIVEALRGKGHIVAVIGDGINDAPALTAAHIGISVISASDISIQVSDLLLTTDKLSVLEKMRMLAKKGRRIVAQNLFWAFFYNVLGIGLAFFGLLSPIFAAFAMSISSLTVILNARRL